MPLNITLGPVGTAQPLPGTGNLRPRSARLVALYAGPWRLLVPVNSLMPSKIQ